MVSDGTDSFVLQEKGTENSSLCRHNGTSSKSCPGTGRDRTGFWNFSIEREGTRFWQSVLSCPGRDTGQKEKEEEMLILFKPKNAGSVGPSVSPSFIDPPPALTYTWTWPSCMGPIQNAFPLESLQDFLIKLDIKTFMHQVEISIGHNFKK